MPRWFYVTSARAPKYVRLHECSMPKGLNYRLRFRMETGRKGKAFIVMAFRLENTAVFFVTTDRRDELYQLTLKQNSMEVGKCTYHDLELFAEFGFTLGHSPIEHPVERGIMLYSSLKTLKTLLGVNIFDFGSFDYETSMSLRAYYDLHEAVQAPVSLSANEGRLNVHLLRALEDE